MPDLLEDPPETIPADASAEDRKRWFTAALIVKVGLPPEVAKALAERVTELVYSGKYLDSPLIH